MDFNDRQRDKICTYLEALAVLGLVKEFYTDEQRKLLLEEYELNLQHKRGEIPGFRSNVGSELDELQREAKEKLIQEAIKRCKEFANEHPLLLGLFTLRSIIAAPYRD